MGGRPRGSGGGRGGSSAGGNGGSGDIHEEYTNQVNSSDCATLRFPATLQRVQADALSRVEEGDVLPIKLRQGNILEVLNNGGEVCGVITGPLMTNLAECLSEGHKFVAAVHSLRDGVCKTVVYLA